MNKILIISILSIVLAAGVVSATISAADARTFNFDPVGIQVRLLDNTESAVNSHDTATLSIPEQQASLDTLTINIRLLNNITFLTPELQQRADLLAPQVQQILDTGLVFSSTFTEFKNVQGKVLLTVTEADKLSFTISNTYDFECSSSQVISNGQVTVAASCTQR